MELQQATFCCWNSSLVCSGHKFCARKGSLLPKELLGTSMEYPSIKKKNKKVCLYPTFWLFECQVLHSPLLCPSPHNSHRSAHQDWVMMPWDTASLGICCPSLSGLPCALRMISSMVEKRSFLYYCNYPRRERISLPISSKDKPISHYFALCRSSPA